jgi:hypothetical protein
LKEAILVVDFDDTSVAASTSPFKDGMTERMRES